MFSLEEFVNKHLYLLDVEREAEIEENKFYTNFSSLKDLQKKGICLLKLCLVNSSTGLFGKTLRTFEPYGDKKVFSSHNIGSGDIVGIGTVTNDGDRDVITNGVVTEVKESRIVVSFDKKSKEAELDSDTVYFLLKLANDVTYKRMKNALKSLYATREERSLRLRDVLFGNTKPSTLDPSVVYTDLKFVNESLNDIQKDAVRFALLQKEVAVIHGPPGTGKTTTVVEIILQAVSRGSKVLACAPSNIAVDNLVEKLAAYKIRIVRLGHPARFLPRIQAFSLEAKMSASDESKVVNDLYSEIDKLRAKLTSKRSFIEKRSLYIENKMLSEEVKRREKALITTALKDANVVLSTLSTASGDGPIKCLPKDHFDIAVIDECSQAIEAICWLPLMLVRKCILAGDHHQLPPTIRSESAAKEGLEITLMERVLQLHGDSIKRMLLLQYRMHEIIMKWPSEQLYNGALQAHDSVKSHLLKDIPGIDDNEDTAIPLLLIDTTGCGLDEIDVEEDDSKGNEGEADIVAVHVNNLINSGVQLQDIAVITPYNLQVDIIKSRLSDRYPELEIRSVDGFQGREKEAVVLSLVRSNNTGNVGFLVKDRRINVAITRARRHLAVICNVETVSHHEFLKCFVNHLKMYGEIRSASQYEREIDLYAEKFCNLNRRFSIEKRKKKSSAEKSNEQNKKIKDSKKKRNSDECFSPPAAKDDGITDHFRKIIKEFFEGKDLTLKFPSSLSAFERRIIHEISEEYGLKHESQGEDSDRHIVVTKKFEDYESVHGNMSSFLQELQSVDSLKKVDKGKKFADDKKIAEGVTTVTNAFDKVCEEKCDEKIVTADSLRKDNDIKITEMTKKTSESIVKCSVCLKMVPVNNIELHSVQCKREKIEKSKKKSKIKPSVLNNPSLLDDDFDAIIDAVAKADRICAYVKCKKCIELLGQTCEFCKCRFCFSHLMPEVHGCGDEAKAQARSLIRKEGKIYPGSGKPEKKTDPFKHAHLQNKLDKKLNELSDKRKPKPKKN